MANKLKEEWERKELKSKYFIKSRGLIEYSSNFELIHVGSNRLWIVDIRRIE